jgi:hypothetical protein
MLCKCEAHTVKFLVLPKSKKLLQHIFFLCIVHLLSQILFLKLKAIKIKITEHYRISVVSKYSFQEGSKFITMEGILLESNVEWLMLT